jgi:hypothetical protein
LAHFFRPFNDIDVFVEDTSSRNFYELILNRILEGKAKVSRVFQLGGKDQVIEMCGRDQEDDGRARLYVIDGDLELLLGVDTPVLRYLYRLNVYSCENLVLCIDAVHQLCYEHATNDPMANIEKLVDYAGFISELESELLELFIVYAAVHELDHEQQTVGYNVFRLCDTSAGPPRIDSAKVTARQQSLLAELRIKCTGDQIRDTITDIRERVSAKHYRAVHVVSGKSYALPLLLAHLKRTVRYRGTQDTLLVQLARHCRLHVDSGLAAAVRDASRKMAF